MLQHNTEPTTMPPNAMTVSPPTTKQSAPAGKLQDWQIQLQLHTVEENNLDHRNFVPLPLWNQNPKMFREPGINTQKVFSRFV
ncbi:unnamed protein product [Cylindrotheca closterium]|uniref:Uncharacterized protein n=1 Tax=Cylindrotheca closterium TaxID=2856 RepID=A0AAD2CWE4_9STRA|nr:unnamed protein product [Cylindrotheca closterium]